MRHSKAPLCSLAWRRNSPVGPVLERLWGNVVTEAPQSGTRRQLQLMGGGGWVTRSPQGTRPWRHRGSWLVPEASGPALTFPSSNLLLNWMLCFPSFYFSKHGSLFFFLIQIAASIVFSSGSSLILNGSLPQKKFLISFPRYLCFLLKNDFNQWP